MKDIKVLHFSSRYEECGVAKYLAHHIKGMVDAPHIKNEYFDVSPYETHNMSPANLEEMATKLLAELADYDVLHVQHEFGLYGHDSFRRVVEAGKKAGKKVVITVHISPSMHGASKAPRLHGFGPHSLVLYMRDMRHHRNFMANQATPFTQADLLLVHNQLTLESLVKLGADPDRIKKIDHPVQEFTAPKQSTVIAEKLHKQKGDVIYCTTGFIHRYKGIIEAIKALKFLPNNYKLAILGGMKQDSDDVAYYNKVCDLIDTLGLHERVYIAGYIASDDDLNAYIRECDVSVYAYDRQYYAAASSGSLNLGFANGKPVIAYPTASIKELAAESDGAVVLCETFAYYELARELQHIDLAQQTERSKAYAQKAAWPKVSQELVKIYEALV